MVVAKLAFVICLFWEKLRVSVDPVMSHQSNQAAELQRFLQSAQQPVWNVIHILQHFFIFYLLGEIEGKCQYCIEVCLKHHLFLAIFLHRWRKCIYRFYLLSFGRN